MTVFSEVRFDLPQLDRKRASLGTVTVGVTHQRQELVERGELEEPHPSKPSYGLTLCCTAETDGKEH